ncbi:MAG: hypothetical protein B6241_11080 [Spirochaetaceae bacterium 4572_59]|nr:MAG: hypothetical protein B6241_11080 [Spirochaetaceae bacterium 4572_59]
MDSIIRQALLQMQNIRYSYGSLKALTGIDFDLYPGEIHGLSGDHGSGKSSLVKLLSGSLNCQKGVIRIKGKLISTLTPSLAVQMGIGMVYQNEEIISTGSLMDNVYLGQFPPIMLAKRKAAILQQCRELFEYYGFDEDPRMKVMELTPTRRQMLPFLRVLARGADILILDEIAQKTTPEEQEHIYKLLHLCRDEGKGIIYVTSNIDEIFRIADRVTILHNGVRRTTEEVSRVDRARLVNLAFNFTMDRKDQKTHVDHKILLISRYDKKIINDMPQGIMIISPSNEIQDINTAAARILECRPEELTGSDLSEYLMALPIEKKDEIHDAIMERRNGLWKSLKFLRNKRLKIRISPLGENGDQNQGLLLFLEDFSSDYETREYLQQAEKFVSTAEMAAGVAHEVNNPLGIIQNYLDLLQMESLSENAVDCVRQIQSELSRIVEIISSLLSFSRAGVRPLKVLNVNDLLDEVLILMGHKLKLREIQLHKQYCRKEFLIRGHENKLKQLFINLLNNASEAVLNKGEIQISTDISREPGDFVDICFTDNGNGIPDDIQEQIFSPFFTTKVTKTNTGLGLSICQHIVESYNGEISVKSTPGEITCFTVRLPLFL